MVAFATFAAFVVLAAFAVFAVFMTLSGFYGFHDFKMICVALALFRMVASMYSPFSENAADNFRLPSQLEIKNFDFKISYSYLLISSSFAATT
jgi:hypothetical protein